VASSEIKPAIITGIVLASRFHKLKTTILVDTESLAIKDVHFTMTRKWTDIGLQVYRRNAEDLQRVPCRCELFVVRSQRGVSHWRDTTANQTQGAQCAEESA